MTNAEFDATYRSTIQRMRNIACRLTHDHNLSEDIAHDSMLKFWIQGINKVGWLVVATWRQARDYTRGTFFKHGTTDPVLMDYYMHGKEPEPIDNLIKKETQELVRSAMAKLSDQDRDLLTQHYFHDRDAARLAKQFGAKKQAVLVRISRARFRLKAILEAA